MPVQMSIIHTALSKHVRALRTWAGTRRASVSEERVNKADELMGLPLRRVLGENTGSASWLGEKQEQERRGRR